MQLKQSLLVNEDSPLSEEVLGYSGPSLRRLYTWVREPMWHFQILADICRVCVRQRGGAVVSAAYTFSYHGDPRAQEISTKILTAVSSKVCNGWAFINNKLKHLCFIIFLNTTNFINVPVYVCLQ